MRKNWVFAFLFYMSGAFFCQAVELNLEMIYKGSVKPLVSHGDPLVFWQIPTSWWAKPRDYVSTENGEIKIFTTAKKKTVNLAYRPIPRQPDIKYKFRAEISKNDLGHAVLYFKAYNRDRRELKSFDCTQIQKAGPQKIERTVVLPSEINGEKVGFINFNFNIKGDGAKLTVKSISLKPIPDLTKYQLGRIKITGKKCTEILVSTQASDHGFYGIRAAKTLRNYLYKMTGEFLPVNLCENSPENLSGKILVGYASVLSGAIKNDELSKLKDGGYILKSDHGFMAFSGKDGTGTVSACWDLLNRLGVRYYSRTDIEIPKEKQININEIKVARSPAFPLRIMDVPWWFYEDYTPFGFSDPGIFGDPSLATLGALGGHTANALVDYRIYGKSHPEYFALGKDGKRLHMKPGYWRFDIHLCLTNPDVQKIAAENLLKWMKLQPHSKYFLVTPGDGTAGFCQCPKCRTLDPNGTHENYVERQYYFNNIMSKKVRNLYPKNKILSIAYTQRLEEPPNKHGMQDNMLSVYCIYPRNWNCQSHAFCSQNRKGIETLNKWDQKYPGKIIYGLYPRTKEEYSLYAPFYAHLKLIKYAAKHKSFGVTFNWSPVSFAPLYLTVISEILWSPDVDVEKSIDKFMAEYFGPAATDMRRFFDLLYSEIKNRPFHQNIEDSNPGLISENFSTKAYQYFANAEKAVADNPKYLKRVLGEKIYLLWNDLNDNNIANGKVERNPELFYRKLSEFASLAKKKRASRFVRHQDPAQWFWSIGRIKIANKLWHKDDAINELISNPLKMTKNLQVRTQVEIPGGWKLPIKSFIGGTPSGPYSYMCEHRDEAAGIRRPGLCRESQMWNILYLDGKPTGEYILEIEGQDDDKPGCSIFAISINGKNIFKGENGFTEKGWSVERFKIPEGILKMGKNRIDFINMTPEKDAHQQKADVDETIGKRKNPYWGWMLFSNVKILREEQK